MMIVDDRAGIRRLLYEVLSGAGYGVLTAAGGIEAVKAISRQPVDLVLLDMKMPGMDGLATLKQLKAICPRVKIVVMTAYEELEILRDAARCGACGYISKPFDIFELQEFVAAKLLEPAQSFS